jgi:hypothetical protein
MIKDLSKKHGPITDLFSTPASKEEWKKLQLSDDQLKFYEENGYVSGVKIFNDKQIDVLQRALTEVADSNHPYHGLFHEFHSNQSADPDTVLLHALGAWRISPAMHDILWNPAFLKPASQLLGGAVRFWHDQIFSKPGKHGGVVAWHQDYSYWTRTIPMNHLTCWVGLDDADQENGCLWYVPGSHKWSLLDMREIAGDMEWIFEFLSDEQKEQFKPVPIELKKGHCTFHHPLMIHGSYENKSDRPRRGIVTNVFEDGTISDSDSPLLEGVPVVAKGKKVSGDFFPLLFDGYKMKG